MRIIAFRHVGLVKAQRQKSFMEEYLMIILGKFSLVQGSDMVFHALTFARSCGRC